MTTMEEAWQWYMATHYSLRRVVRLASHWDSLPWDGPLGHDSQLQTVETPTLRNEAELAQQPLDDLAILVLFSVFESIVRAVVIMQVKPEADLLKHPTMKQAGQDALEAIEEGSFFRVLESYKAEGYANLIEQINQIRRYRNWVAYGRRGVPENSVNPRMVFDRLRQFLNVIQHYVQTSTS
jgi:hypothetical protein